MTTTERTRNSTGTGGTLTLVAMIFVVAMTMIDMTIVSIAAPDIQRELGLTSTGVQWVVTGYLVALAAVFALGGRLADVMGHRTMVVVGTLLFIISSALCGATPEGSIAETWIVSFRVLQGAGAALLFPAALAVLVSAFPVERRGRAVAIFFGVAGGLTSIGPFAGGYLTEWTWRSIFWVNIPIAIIGLVLTFVAKVDNDRVREPIDWIGAVLIASGMGVSVLGLQQAQSWGWSSTATLGCVVGGAVLIGLFVEYERRAKHPLIRVAFFSNRVFATQNLVLLFASAAFVPMFFFSSMYAQVGLGWSTSNAGLYLLIFFAGFAPGAQLGGRLLDKGRARAAAVWGSALSAAGLFSWAARLQDLSENQQWPWIVVAGVGLGMVIGSCNTDAINQVPAANYGEATGVTQTSRNYGASLGIAILGTLMTSSLTERVTTTLTGAGVDPAQAESITHSLHGSGGGEPSGAISQLGPKAPEVLQAIRLDFADASQLAFRGLGVFMVVAAVAAIIGLPRHRTTAAADPS